MSARRGDSRILVVDDDEQGRELLREVLGREGHVVEVAASGDEAWERLLAAGPPIDVILLDWVMPGMSGIELLDKIKQDARLETIPVVVATAITDRDVMVRGIAAGAYYFVTKPVDRELLCSIVCTAATDHERYRGLQEMLRRGIDAIGTLREGHFRFRAVSRATALATLLSQACPDPERTVVGLGELLVNAVEHGSLGITYDDKSRLLASGGWEAEVERRLALPENCDKYVAVRVRRDAEEIEFDITDQGPGFDWKRYLTVAPERVFDSHGRGIAMANLMSFQRLQYHDPGNRVTAAVRLAEPV
jgi:CheY-like chemotaxis protein/anti-sigma regulatory factor (Ser/Thr protein kinase)